MLFKGSSAVSARASRPLGADRLPFAASFTRPVLRLYRNSYAHAAMSAAFYIEPMEGQFGFDRALPHAAMQAYIEHSFKINQSGAVCC